jgi:hypothetical protein
LIVLCVIIREKYIETLTIFSITLAKVDRYLPSNVRIEVDREGRRDGVLCAGIKNIPEGVADDSKDGLG